jgi:hypothetical protein
MIPGGSSDILELFVNGWTTPAVLAIARTASGHLATAIVALGLKSLGRRKTGTLSLLRRGLLQLLQLVPQLIDQGIFVRVGQGFEVR